MTISKALPVSFQIRVHRAWRALNQGKNPENIATYQAVVAQAVRSLHPDEQLKEIEQRRYMTDRMKTAPRNPDGSAQQLTF